MPSEYKPNLGVITITAATTLNADGYAGRTISLNSATGRIVSLPAATGSGVSFTIFVGTTVSSGSHVIAANGTDIIQGSLALSTDAAGVTCPTAADTDKITMNGSTTGGVKGSWVEVQDIASGLWSVKGGLVCTGAEATPFGAS